MTKPAQMPLLRQHMTMEASAARDDQAEDCSMREDYKFQAREDYNSESAARKGDVLLQQHPQVRDKYQYFLPESLEMRACACCGELTFLNESKVVAIDDAWAAVLRTRLVWMDHLP